jgi:hypothetical protein
MNIAFGQSTRLKIWRQNFFNNKDRRVRPEGRTNFEKRSGGRFFKVAKHRNIYCGAAFGCQTEPLVFPTLFRGRSSKNRDQ